MPATIAYIDSSVLVGILFREPGWKDVLRRIRRFSRLISSNLIEAEVLAAAKREQISLAGVITALDSIDKLSSHGSLLNELREILDQLYLRGADAYHLACAAASAGPHQKDLYFITLDQSQKLAAGKLGFALAA